jgi:hypothetical protein
MQEAVDLAEAVAGTLLSPRIPRQSTMPGLRLMTVSPAQVR